MVSIPSAMQVQSVATSGPADGALAATVLNPARFALLLRRRLRLVAGTTALGVALALALLMVVAPKYTATAILLVDPRQQQVLPSESVLPGIGNDTAAVESQVEVIQSTQLAHKVIAELGLDGDPEFSGASFLAALKGKFRRLFGLPSESGGADDRVLSAFEQALGVKRRGLTYVIEITFKSRSADKAARIANAVAAAYVNEQVGLKSGAATDASDRIGARLADLRADADRADKAVADYKASHGLVDIGDRRSLVGQQLADLSQQLILAKAHASDMEARYDQVRHASSEPGAESGLPEALGSQVILALRTQYAQADRQRAELAQIYGPRYPASLTAHAQLEALRRQIAGELARLAAGARSDLEAARGRVRLLDAGLDGLKRQSAEIDRANVQLQGLERDADATHAVLAQFLLRSKETTEQQSLQVPDARILSPASAPLKPSSPIAALVLSLGALAGLVAGTGLALGLELSARGFRSARDAESLLDLPVLGLIPEIAPEGTEAGSPHRRPSRHGVDHPLSAFGEAIRGLAIRLRTQARNGPLTLLVTAATPGEGTSTVAANLAHVLARSGVATLLVDADMRQASAKSPAPGLYEALRDGEPPMALLRRDPASGLQVLPAGGAASVEEASELLTGAGTDIVLDYLKAKFDLIVIDGAPLLTTVDGRYLLDLVDTALLVVAWARTDRDSVAAALDAAGPNAGKIQGLALNRVDLDAYRFHDETAPRSFSAA